MSKMSRLLVIGSGPIIIGQAADPVHLVDDVADAFRSWVGWSICSSIQGRYDDSCIRKAAIRHKVSYMTTLATAVAAAKGIAAHRNGKSGVKSLQSYHADIK